MEPNDDQKPLSKNGAYETKESISQQNFRKSKSPPSGLAGFWQELKRRHVVRVGTVYAVVAWLIIQIAATTFSGFGIPDWAFRFVVLMVLLGFPVSLIIAWAFELTPDGIKTTKHAREEQGEAPLSETQQKKRNWMAYLVGALIPTLIFGALALFFYFQTKPAQEPIPPSISQLPSRDNDKSIAVLPLANMSPDPENAFFADGVHEDILTNLAKIRDLLVIGRTSTLEYRATTKKLKDIGRELGVRYLVEGSVRRAGNQVKITVQLIDVQTGGHIWADDYNRSLDDIFAIQAAVAKDIASQVHAVLLPEEIAQIQQLPTKSQEAYDLFMQQRQLLATATPGSTMDERISLLERAVELDPEFALAWSGLAAIRYVDWNFRKGRSDSQLLDQANQALAEAKRLAPDSAYAVSAEASYYNLVLRNSAEAIRLLLKALSIDPSHYESQGNLAYTYHRLGQLEEAQFHMEAALRRDPLNEFYKRRIYRIYQERPLWDEALSEIKKNLETTPNNNYWKRLLVELKFLRYGDRRTFIEEMAALPSSRNDLKRALWSADYAEALQLLEGWDSDGAFGFLYRSISIPKDLLSALIWFTRDNLDQSRSNAEKARSYWKEITENALSPDPADLSQLAISHAVLGDEDAVEAMIPKIRKLTTEPYFKYENQAQCEFYIAICYLVLGDHDKAIETLEAASRLDGLIFLKRELDLWFIFDRLRGNPRFDALLED